MWEFNRVAVKSIFECSFIYKNRSIAKNENILAPAIFQPFILIIYIIHECPSRQSTFKITLTYLSRVIFSFYLSDYNEWQFHVFIFLLHRNSRHFALRIRSQWNNKSPEKWMDTGRREIKSPVNSVPMEKNKNFKFRFYMNIVVFGHRTVF